MSPAKGSIKKADQPKTLKLRKFVLGFAIGIVFVLFVFYGIRTFYEEPDWNKMCAGRDPYAVPLGKVPDQIDQSKCDAIMQNENLPCEPQYRMNIYNSTLGCYTVSCNICQMDFDKAKEKYDSDVFIISIVAGGIALFVGVILGVEAVGSGLMFGGVITIFVGVIRNWGHLGNIVKFLILGIVLAALIFIGYKKLKD
ncbi:MAG: hypothetical protein AABX51_00365 [Nanoarchaeota archaeon]